MSTGASSSFGRRLDVAHRGDAFVNLQDSPFYQRGAFEDGLSAAGFSIRRSPAMPPKAGDLLVIWNRYTRDEQLARAYEAVGGTVIVAENAYLGPEDKAHHWFALAIGHHLGAGHINVGQRTRHEGLWGERKPWRKTGVHIVILPQRGMGEPGVRMPAGWPLDVIARIKRMTERPIVVRPHPGTRPPEGHPPPELWTELRGAWAGVTWGSGAGIKALCEGIPVFYELPQWIGADAARFGIVDGQGRPQIEAPYLGDRGTMLRKLSWAQWSADELRTGEPFNCLLSSS